jgi:membrane protease YdiL (CAAX protease family)
MTSKIKKRPLLSFYLSAFLITWLAWLPQAAYSRNLFPFDSPLFYFIGGIGPMLAAYLVLRVEHGSEAITLLFAPFLKWNVSIIWYAIAVFTPILFGILGTFLSGNMTAINNFNLPTNIVTIAIVDLIAAIPEEVAWRGFALPRFQKRYSALASSLILGVLWGFWHLPLLLNLSNVMSTYPILLFLIEIIGSSVLYT